MDLFWIKTLAKSSYRRGRWTIDNPHEVKSHNKMAVVGTISEIYQDLVLSINTYNEYVEESKMLRLFPIYSERDHHMNGFVIMVKNLQVRLERSGAKLQAILESTQAFRRQREVLHVFEARLDALGGLAWVMDKEVPMTSETIIRQLLHDLCSTAFEIET